MDREDQENEPGTDRSNEVEDVGQDMQERGVHEQDVGEQEAGDDVPAAVFHKLQKELTPANCPPPASAGLSASQAEQVWLYFLGYLSRESWELPELLLEEPRFRGRGPKLALLKEPVLHWLLFELELPVSPHSNIPDVLAWLLHYGRQAEATRLLEQGRPDPEAAWNTNVRWLLRGDRWLLEHGKVNPDTPVRGAPALSYIWRWGLQLEMVAAELPPDHAFHGFWGRHQKTGLPPFDSSDGQPSQKRRRLPKSQSASSAAAADSDADSNLEDDPAWLVDRLLEHRSEAGAPHEEFWRNCITTVVNQNTTWMQTCNGYFSDYPDQEKRMSAVFADFPEAKLRMLIDLVIRERVRTLLEFGADPNPELEEGRWHEAVHHWGHTPLSLTYSPEILRLLLAAGANPDTCRHEFAKPPLVAQASHPENVQLLLDAGASCVSQETGLHLEMIRAGAHPDSVRMVLDRGVELCRLDATPMRRLLEAASDENQDLVDLVMQLPFSLPARCPSCEPPDQHQGFRRPGCWTLTVDPRTRGLNMKALIDIGYPVRQPQVQESMEFLQRQIHRPACSKAYVHRARWMLELLQGVTVGTSSTRVGS